MDSSPGQPGATLFTCHLLKIKKWTKKTQKKSLFIVFPASPGHAVLLILAHVTGAAVGEEMGGSAPYSAASLPPVAVHAGLRLLQVRCRTAATSCTRRGRSLSFLPGLYICVLHIHIPLYTSALYAYCVPHLNTGSAVQKCFLLVLRLTEKAN